LRVQSEVRHNTRARCRMPAALALPEESQLRQGGVVPRDYGIIERETRPCLAYHVA
jgi:hypothetical protein